MKRYTKTPLCERYEINKGTQPRIQATQASQARSAQARFSFAGLRKAHVLQPKTAQPEDPDTQKDPSPDIYEQMDSFIDQCVYEWAQWLLTQELRNSQMAYKYRTHFTPIEWPKTTTRDKQDE